jgi:hypothetical protein
MFGKRRAESCSGEEDGALRGPVACIDVVGALGRAELGEGGGGGGRDDRGRRVRGEIRERCVDGARGGAGDRDVAHLVAAEGFDVEVPSLDEGAGGAARGAEERQVNDGARGDVEMANGGACRGACGT